MEKPVIKKVAIVLSTLGVLSCGSDVTPSSTDMSQTGELDMADVSQSVDAERDMSANLDDVSQADAELDADSSRVESVSVEPNDFRTCALGCMDNQGTCTTVESPLWGDIVGNRTFEDGSGAPIFSCSDEPDPPVEGEPQLESVECFCLV